MTAIKQQRSAGHGTKLALTVGIKACAYEHIVFTTTDCYPSSDKWLSLMAKGFINGDIVIGYCGIEPGKGFANRLDAVQPARRIGALAVRRDPGPSLPGHRGQHRLHQKPLLRKPGFQLSEHGDRRRRPVHPEDRDVRQRKRRHESGRDDASGSFRRTGLVARGTAVLRLFVPVLSRPRQAVGTYGALEPPAVLRAVGNGRSAASPPLIAVPLSLVLIRLLLLELKIRRIGRRVGERGLAWAYILHDFWAPVGEFALALGNRIRPNRKIWR